MENVVMGMQMRVTSKLCQYEFDIVPEVIEAIHKHGDMIEMAHPRHIRGWFGMIDASEVSVSQFIEALEVLRSRISDNECQSYIYSIRTRLGGDSGFEIRGPGCHGFRIDGEIYGIDSGLDKCVLSRWRIKDDGTGEIVGKIDVRDRKQIETDSWGPIYIYKRRAAGDCEKWIKKVINKLKKMEGEILVEFA